MVLGFCLRSRADIGGGVNLAPRRFMMSRFVEVSGARIHARDAAASSESMQGCRSLMSFTRTLLRRIWAWCLFMFFLVLAVVV